MRLNKYSSENTRVSLLAVPLGRAHSRGEEGRAMATRYAGKYRRSPYPQATRIKTFNFLWYLSLGGGDVWA